MRRALMSSLGERDRASLTLRTFLEDLQVLFTELSDLIDLLLLLKKT